jgi:hypothetical protein
VPEENPKMLQIIERYEDVDGVLVRCESGFTDDSACPDAEAPATLTRMDHVVGFVALVGAILGIILVVWSFIAVAAAAILWTPGLVQ